MLSSVQGARSYVIVAKAGKLPKNLSTKVAAAGGTLTSAMDQIGVATASSDNPAFAAAASAAIVADVVEDVAFMVPQPRTVEATFDELSEPSLGEASVGSLEQLRNVQWAPDAVSAPAAWDLGYQGENARVAVLDGGIHSTHVDLAANLDVAHSRSFVAECVLPGQTTKTSPCPFNVDQAADTSGNCAFNANNTPTHTTFWHGTHVAGIVAAAANGAGVVGIAPKAKIIGVKVLHCGSGNFGSVISGIVYAATPIAEGGGGADIINMSLGAVVAKGALPGVESGAGIAHLLVALSRATSYANTRNVTVVAAAGNNALDLDHSRYLISIPAQSVGVISVSALAPLGWALGNTNFDRPASYTNFGQSAVSFAAPGGDLSESLLLSNQVCSKPVIPAGNVINLCAVFDMVLAPFRGGVSSNTGQGWASGTSMASPVVAGVAALIVGKYGNIGPTAVEQLLRKSADDLGKPGNDDFYGGGRVNALRAVQ